MDKDEIIKNQKAYIERLANSAINPPVVIMPGSDAAKENEKLRSEIKKFKRIVGNFYIKGS